VFVPQTSQGRGNGLGVAAAPRGRLLACRPLRREGGEGGRGEYRSPLAFLGFATEAASLVLMVIRDQPHEGEAHGEIQDEQAAYNPKRRLHCDTPPVQRFNGTSYVVGVTLNEVHGPEQRSAFICQVLGPGAATARCPQMGLQQTWAAGAKMAALEGKADERAPLNADPLYRLQVFPDRGTRIPVLENFFPDNGDREFCKKSLQHSGFLNAGGSFWGEISRIP
jgi:hypothetical protein